MKRRKYAVLFIFAVMFVAVCVPVPAQAKTSKKKKAMKAYTKFLKKNESKFTAVEGDTTTKNSENYKKCSSFMLLDLNKDGIAELITYHDVAYKTGNVYVYTYKKKKVKLLKDKNKNYAKVPLDSSGGGSHKIFACSNGHLHVHWTGGYLGYTKAAYTMKKGKFKEYLYLDVSSSSNKKICRINGKDVKAKKVKKKLKSCKEIDNGEMKTNSKSKRKEFVK